MGTSVITNDTAGAQLMLCASVYLYISALDLCYRFLKSVSGMLFKCYLKSVVNFNIFLSILKKGKVHSAVLPNSYKEAANLLQASA
jgi:hypothetical protein